MFAKGGSAASSGGGGDANIVDGFDMGNLVGVLKAGWLIKQGQNNASTWNKRFFCLFKDRLAYYRDVKNISELIPLRTLVFTADINCRECVIPGMLKDHRFCFEIRTPFDQSMIEATTDEERQSWITNLNDCFAVYKDSLCGYMKLDLIVKNQVSTTDYFFILHKDTGVLLMFQDHENTTNSLHDITMDRNTKISLHLAESKIKIAKSVILTRSTGISTTSNDISYAITFEINKNDIQRWYDMMLNFISLRIREEEERLAKLAAEEAERKRKEEEAEAERKRLAEEAERKRLAEEAEAERRRIAEEAETERKIIAQEAERKRLSEEEAKRLAGDEAERKRRAEEEAKILAADEAERKRIAEEAAKRNKLIAEEAERMRLAEEAAKRKAVEEAEARRLAEVDARTVRVPTNCVVHADLNFFIVTAEGQPEWQEGTIMLLPNKIIVNVDQNRIIHEFHISPSSAVFDATKLLDPATGEFYQSFGFSCGAGKILHVLTTTEEINTLWITHILAQIPASDYLSEANPALSIHRDAIALIEKDKFYEIHLQELKAIGVCLVNCNNLVVVSQLNNDSNENGMKRASILTRMYGKKVKHNYELVAEELRHWKPPMRLQFRKFPEMEVNPCHLYVSSEGSESSSKDTANWCAIKLRIFEGGLTFTSSDGASSIKSGEFLLERRILLAGASVHLCDNGHVLVSYGYDTFLVKFGGQEESHAWTSLIFHGISLSNGGRHLLQYNKDSESEADQIEEVNVEIVAVELEVEQRPIIVATSEEAGGGGAAEVVEVEEPGELADADDLIRLFRAYVNYSKDKIKFEYDYLNPMQFSTIWRMVTGERGNLFKEMQTFNRYNKHGNAAMSEEEFVEGWLSLCAEQKKLGRHYLIVIKKLLGKNNVLL